ncbi:MAG: hypothetical protein WKF99_04240, partial [Solirubrobacteraceae bacterium]
MLAWVRDERLRERLAPRLDGVDIAAIPARPAQDPDLERVEAIVPTSSLAATSSSCSPPSPT